MPATVNGIGTHYYGKKDLERYQGFCENCRAQRELMDYETRLWLVVFFVPVIPLGSKQILGDCTACRRHRVTSAGNWRKLGEDVMRDGMERMSREPSNPTPAVELLNSFEAFRKRDEARRLAEVLSQRFPNDADVRLRLGAFFETAGDASQADTHFRRALELAPDNLAAKHAVVVGHIQQGNFEAARKLMTSAPALTAKIDPPVYVLLGDALQKAGRHDEAREIYRELVAAVPAAGFDKPLRKRIRASERAASAAESMLPPMPLLQRRGLLFAAAVAVVLAGVAFVEYYIAAHRRVHVVNGFERPIEVRLDDGERRTVGARSFAALPSAEGTHVGTASIDGREFAQHEFAIESNFFARLFRSPAYVWNVGGGGVVVERQIVYSSRQPVKNDTDGRTDLHVGKPFITIADADYLFTDPPQQISSESSRVLKTYVGMEPAEPLDVVFGAPDKITWPDRLTLLEGHLQALPDDPNLLSTYADVSFQHGQAPRCRRFLEAELARRPADVAWHRTYQSFREGTGDDATLRDEYVRRMEAEPNNGDWPYLVGRLEPEAAKAMQLYERAIKLKPEGAYPWMAKSYHLRNQGDFAAAKRAIGEARRLAPNNAEFRDSDFVIRLGAGDFAALEAELRGILKAKQTSLEDTLRLLEVLGLQGKQQELRQARDEFIGHIDATNPAAKATITAIIDLDAYLFAGDFRQLLARAETVEDAQLRAGRKLIAHFELGQLDEAAKSFQELNIPSAPFVELCFSVAWRTRGDDQTADEWRRRAVEHWRASGKRDQKLAELFEKSVAVTPAATHEIDTSAPYEKALVLVALAQRQSQRRDELLRMVDVQNFRSSIGRAVVAEAVAALRKQPATKAGER